jgi:hypothetical protein
MSVSAWMVIAIVGTCLLIFGLTVLLTPLLQRFRHSQGLDSGPEPPLRKQYRGVGIVCVGSGIATTLFVFADGSVVLYVLAAAVFIVMMTVVLKSSIRDAREAQREQSRRDASGLNT